MGVEPEKLTRQELRTIVCAQCHVTYNIIKDQEMNSVGIYFPWQGSTIGKYFHREYHQKIAQRPVRS